MASTLVCSKTGKNFLVQIGHRDVGQLNTVDHVLASNTAFLTGKRSARCHPCKQLPVNKGS